MYITTTNINILNRLGSAVFYTIWLKIPENTQLIRLLAGT